MRKEAFGEGQPQFQREYDRAHGLFTEEIEAKELNPMKLLHAFRRVTIYIKGLSDATPVDNAGIVYKLGVKGAEKAEAVGDPKTGRALRDGADLFGIESGGYKLLYQTIDRGEQHGAPQEDVSTYKRPDGSIFIHRRLTMEDELLQLRAVYSRPRQ